MSGNAVFAATSTIVVAFSPEFWILALQNRSYALLLLVMVLYLSAWRTKDDVPPSGLRLFAAGFLLLLAILLQEAVILVVPAAVVILIALGHDARRRRFIRGVVWGGSIATLVLSLYLGVWSAISASEHEFFRWTAMYAYEIHAPDIFEMSVPMLLVKSVIGIAGLLVQSTQVMSFLHDNSCSSTIVAAYTVVGFLTCVAIGWTAWRAKLGGPVVHLIRTNPLFAMSFLWILCWSAWVFAWEPVSSQYWIPALPPALVCLGILLRDRITPHRAYLFAGSVFVVSAWNVYFNHQNDRDLSRNFPPPLVATIEQHLGPHDLFIVLAKEYGLGNMDYDLLFVALQYAPRNPGLAVLDDFVWPTGNSPTWRDKLRTRINSTLDSGGRVFVAAHLFDRGSYNDLASTDDPFAIMVQRQYPANQGQRFQEEVRMVLASYNLQQSDFSIGPDRYFLLQRK